jgi:ribosomal protein L37E
MLEHPIYRNALNAIQVGVEDFNEGSPPRLSSAVRNMTAGILLLCKEKLRRLSPEDELLIWKQITPSLDDDGNVVFEKSGKTTVDVAEIIARFKSCEIEADANLLRRITEIRNRVEHHHVDDVSQIRGAFADGLLFLSQFMPRHLGLDPQEEIDEDAWSSLVAEKEVEDRLRAECKASYVQIDGPDSLTDAIEQEGCPECSSQLIRQIQPQNINPFEAIWACRACGHTSSNQDWISRILPNFFSGSSYLAAKDNSPAPLDTCPECQEEVYVNSEEICFACGFELEPSECAVCSEPLGLDEYGETICSYHRYVAEKERDR